MSPSKKRISERIVEQIVDPVSRGGLPGSSSSHSPTGDEERADEPGKGVFRTFPQNKKMRSWARTRGRNCSPSRAHLRDDNSGKPYYWNRRTFRTVWKPPPGVKVVWVGERNEEGRVWYWHRDTRVSTFDLPPLPG